MEAALAGVGTRRGRPLKRLRDEIEQEGDFLQLDVPGRCGTTGLSSTVSVSRETPIDRGRTWSLDQWAAARL